MSETVFAVIRRTREILENALAELDKFERSLREAEPRAQAEVTLTPEVLDKLPWKRFPNGEGEWIFSDIDDPIVKTLRELLNKYSGKLEIHRYTYRLSSNGKFISRLFRK